MKCKKCKKEIPDEAGFCHHCGYDVSEDQPKPKPNIPVKPLAIAGAVALALLAIFIATR